MDDEDRKIAAISLKLPPIWEDNVKNWFTQCESQFALKGITVDDTKYHHIVSSLTSSMSKKVQSVLDNPPAAGKYQAIKKLLVGRLELSKHERASRIMNLQGLGGLSPIDLYTEVRALGDDLEIEDVYFSVVLLHLPEKIRSALLALKKQNVSNQEIFIEASSMLMSTPPSSVNAVQSGGRATEKKSKLCFFHRRWGKKANKCVKPCEWKGPPVNAIEYIVDETNQEN